MNAETVRLNITIPKDLAHALNRFAGPRKCSQFIGKLENKEMDLLDKATLIHLDLF
jgi:hypothetical protein